jgi:long-chain acyl-CoA synthetase
MDLFYRRFSQSASRRPDQVAVEVQRRDHIDRLTYSELHRMAESVGRWLQQNSVAAGSRCAIYADNSAPWVVSYLGIFSQGCAAVPLDSNYHADQVHKLLLDSGAVLLFCDARHLAQAIEAVAETPAKIVLLDAATGSSSDAAQKGTAQPVAETLDSILAGNPANATDFTAAEAQESDLAVLLYTSGTTSDPKGVMLSHGNLASEVAAVVKFVSFTESDAVLGILPLFHSLAQVTNLLLPLSVGARVVYLETLNTTELLRGLRERGISAFCVVPQFFYLIHERIQKEIAKRGFLARKVFGAMLALNRSLRKLGVNAGKLLFGKIHATFGSRMRLLVTGGSRFDPEISREFYALGIDVLQAYGLTETTGGATVTPPGHLVIGSVGKPLPGVEVKILDPQPQDEGPPSGEIAIRGPNVMLGYYNRPDATAAALLDGWLSSGDLGYVDRRGYVFVTGRKKELIVLANGKNLYPDEIESYYLKSAFVKEICVMALQGTPGDPTSDPKKERLHAVIVPDFEVLKERKIVNAKEAIRWDIEGISHNMPSMKRILSYDIWQEELPRTTTRKIKRFEVEKRVKEQQARGGADANSADPNSQDAKPPQPEISAADSEWLEQPDVERVLPLIREASKGNISTILPDSSLELDLGLDSMQRIELLVSIEEELGGKVEESQLGDIYTVRQLVEAVVASVGAGGGKRTEAAGWSTVLREEPTDPEVLALVKPQPVSAACWFLVAKLAHLLARVLYGLKVTGMEKIPANGPFILSSNHQSYIDPAVLGAILPWKHFKNLFSVGTSEIFGSGIMHWIARQLRIVVVDPDANLVPAMKAGAFGLRNGKVLILYPEGERSVDGSPKRFKKGAAILATHLRVPIVPIAIEGFYDAWPRGKHFFQKITKLTMTFGDPIPPPEGEPTEQLATQMMMDVKARVFEMWTVLNREYRGEKSSAAKAAD